MIDLFTFINAFWALYENWKMHITQPVLHLLGWC